MTALHGHPGLLFIVLAVSTASIVSHVLDLKRLKGGDETAYQSCRIRFSLFREGVSLVALGLFWFFGGFGLIASWTLSISGTWHQASLLAGFLFAAGVFLLLELFHLPFSLYETYGIEARFGYNRTRIRTFVADRLKSALLELIIGGGLYLILHRFFLSRLQLGWVYAWLAYSVVSLLLLFIAPSILLPLFYRFSPMEEGSLKMRLKELSRKAGLYPLKIEQIDGSRRSTKANAFVAGFGAKRRVAFYDTFLQEREEEEALAVAAHEFGHIKHRHVQKQLITQIGLSLPVFYLFSRLLTLPITPRLFNISPELLEQTGAGGIMLILSLLVFSIASQLFSPISAFASRKREYQADAWVKEQSPYAPALARALVDLEEKNGSHPNPSRLSIILRYSHPTVAMRCDRL